jgi:hypothetical protein
MLGTATPFQRMPRARRVHHDVSHGLGAEREEVGAALPGDVPGFHKTQVRLVDQGGGLKCESGMLTPHPGVGERAQLAVDERDQPLEGGIVSLAPGEKQSGDVRRTGCCHTGPRLLGATWFRRPDLSTLPGRGWPKTGASRRLANPRRPMVVCALAFRWNR